ncbi:MAG: GrpB family protein [Flavipsychrobacter sp.]|nr:GrpB family protein [Flavipsychrobacter sp.]
MRYYSLGLSVEPRVTGLRDAQAQIIIDEKAFSKEYAEQFFDFFNILRYRDRKNKHPDFDVVVENAVKLKTAKEVDFYRFSPALAGCPFMVSHKAMAFLEQFNLGAHYFYKVYSDRGNGKEHAWNLLYLIWHEYDAIDFSQSLFKKGHIITGDFQLLKFRNAQEYIDHSGVPENIKIALSAGFDEGLDLFYLRSGGLFISERLWKAIQAEGLTGLDIYGMPACFISGKEPITPFVLVPHDDSWVEEYEKESEKISKALGDSILSVHHIGSTAVPGLMSRPVIDIAVAFRKFYDRRIEKKLEKLGYISRGQNYMNGFWFSKTGEVTFHLHFDSEDMEVIKKQVKFRNRLKRDEELRRKYEAFKVAGSKNRDVDDIEYIVEKGAFIEEHL